MYYYNLQSVPLIFKFGSSRFGQTVPHWIVSWWKWLLSIPRESSPAFDLSGVNAASNQTDPHVFYLCQTWEIANPFPIRKVAIPRGRCVFMPIINWLSFSDVNGNVDDQQMDKTARNRIDAVSHLEVRLNDEVICEPLLGLRSRTPFFDFSLPSNNIFGLSSGKRRGISDGYWLFTYPLEQDLRLSTFGACSSGTNKIGIKYDIKLI